MEVMIVVMEAMKILRHVNQVARKHVARNSSCVHLQQRNTHTVDVFQSHGDVILIMIVLMEGDRSQHHPDHIIKLEKHVLPGLEDNHCIDGWVTY